MIFQSQEPVAGYPGKNQEPEIKIFRPFLKTTAQLLIALLFAACANGQKQSEAVQAHPAEFAAYITPESAEKHLSILASDEYEGRGTGQEGGRMTEIYLAGAFKKLGLRGPLNGSYFQPVHLPVGSPASKADPGKAANVLGYLEGSDSTLKEELIVITAHHDHLGKHNEVIYNGADDDGSGVTAVLLLAGAFREAQKAGEGPKRSLLFMTLTGEEMGLIGSAYYSDNPVYPLEHTIANLNIDMIGRIDKKHNGNPDYVYIIGSDRLSTDLHRINEEANATYTRLELDYTYNDPDDPNRFYYRSDHYNFAKHKIPVIFYFNGVHADYHRPSDTVDKIDFEALTKRARLVFHTAWELANREKRPAVNVE